MRKYAVVTVMLAGVFLALSASSRSWAGDEGLKAKGQIKIGDHTLKMQAGTLYEVVVEGKGFHPMVTLRPGFFTLARYDSDKRDMFQGFVFPREAGEHRIYVLPDVYGELPKELEYTLTVKSISLAEKPLLEEKAKLTEDDKVYENKDLFGKRDTFFKAYPIKLKAEQFYIIDMVRPDMARMDPYLFLEGPDGKIVASNDDGAGNLNSRIIYQPRKDGEHRIIATTLSRATGEFTLTVRTQGTAKKTDDN